MVTPRGELDVPPPPPPAVKASAPRRQDPGEASAVAGVTTGTATMPASEGRPPAPAPGLPSTPPPRLGRPRPSRGDSADRTGGPVALGALKSSKIGMLEAAAAVPAGAHAGTLSSSDSTGKASAGATPLPSPLVSKLLRRRRGGGGSSPSASLSNLGRTVPAWRTPSPAPPSPGWSSSERSMAACTAPGPTRSPPRIHAAAVISPGCGASLADTTLRAVRGGSAPPARIRAPRCTASAAATAQASRPLPVASTGCGGTMGGASRPPAPADTVAASPLCS